MQTLKIRNLPSEATMTNLRNCFGLLALGIGLLSGAQARGENQQIFQIGRRDETFMEFSRERELGHPVAYRVGQSSAAKDWYAYHPGSFDYQVGESTRERDWVEYQPGSTGNLSKDPVPIPFRVVFTLRSAPTGKFVLHLDAIFRHLRPAAPRYAVEINGKSGSYQMHPQPAPDLWWSTGGEAGLQYVGYESLDMSLPASYFRQGSNTLTVRCLDGFGIYYDDLSLSNEPGESPPQVVQASVQPTVFYKSRGSGIVELADVRIRTSRPLGNAMVKVVVGSTEVNKEIQQSEFGDADTRIEIPAPEQPLPVTLYISGETAPVYRGTFVPPTTLAALCPADGTSGFRLQRGAFADP